MTGGAVINSALTEIEVIRAGQTPNPSESAVGLLGLNNLLDSFAAERLLIPVVQQVDVGPLTTARNIFIGPGAAPPFNIARPIRIDSAGIRWNITVSANVYTQRADLRILTLSEYARIAEKGAVADTPEALYYEPYSSGIPGFALVGAIYLYPTPSLSGGATFLELETWQALTAFPDLTTDVSLPTGYARLLTKSLAVELAGQFVNAKLSPETQQEALEARAMVMKLNSTLVASEPDIAIPPATSVQFVPVPSTLKATAQAKTERAGG